MSEKLRILVGDKLAPAGIEYLQSAGDIDVDVKTGLSEDELTEIIGRYHGLIVRSGVQVTAKVLAQSGNLRAVARAGVGVDNIDLDAATARGVLVMNSADASTITTAEHAFAMMMALARNIGPAYKTMADGGWDRSSFVGTQLSGKTLGVVGFGRIGRTVAERALAFGMTVAAFDPVFNAETALDGRVAIVKDFDAMIPRLDFITFHVPLNDNTRHMLGPAQFAAAKPGLRVVNAARGGVVDIPAMLDAIESGQCGGAAIDVFESEPPAEDDPLRRNPKVLVTPHLGASTAEAQQAVSTDACAQLVEFLRGQGIRGAVNLGGVRMDLDPALEPFVELAERMARIIGPMCDHGIGDVTVTLDGESIASAGSTLERMTVINLLQTLLDDPVNLVNVNLIAEQRGITSRTVINDKPTKTAKLRIDVQSGETVRYIVGSVFADGKPRVLNVCGYHMDMVPEGFMLLVQNQDKPGMVGLLGTLLADAGMNIADMALARGEDADADKAIMVVKLDSQPTEALLNRLKAAPGILKVAALSLPRL